jgi:biotin carboxylase
MDISERLTFQQIRERYPNQWVVLVEHDWDEVNLSSYTTARVFACGGSRAEAIARARPALDAYQCYGCRYTGTIHSPLAQLKQFELERELKR